MEEIFKQKIDNGECIQHSNFEDGYGYYIKVGEFTYTVIQTFTTITEMDGCVEDVEESFSWEQADENEVEEFLEIKEYVLKNGFDVNQ